MCRHMHVVNMHPEYTQLKMYWTIFQVLMDYYAWEVHLDLSRCPIAAQKLATSLYYDCKGSDTT